MRASSHLASTGYGNVQTNSMAVCSEMTAEREVPAQRG